IVAADPGINGVSVLVGNGDGTFQAQKTIAAGSKPNSLAVADINGDGRPDLVVSDSSGNNIGVLQGNGDGTFRAPIGLTAGTMPSFVVTADVNSDGRPDII